MARTYLISYLHLTLDTSSPAGDRGGGGGGGGGGGESQT